MGAAADLAVLAHEKNHVAQQCDNEAGEPPEERWSILHGKEEDRERRE
jgi:hypothetical protein